MSVGYAEFAPTASMPGTGAALYPPALLDPDEIKADQGRTHIVPNGLADPVLRDVLVSFQDALVHQLRSITGRVSSLAVRGATASPLVEVLKARGLQDLAPYGIPVSQRVTFATNDLPVMTHAGNVTATWTSLITHGGTIPTTGQSRVNRVFARNWDNDVVNVISAAATGIFHAVAAGPNTFTLLLDETQALPAATIFAAYTGTIGDPVVEQPTAPLAVRAVDDIADWLGVPAADVFRGTGVAKRTYQEWKRTGTRRPRPSSEGRLWELHQLAADLIESMGPAGVRRWFQQDPARRKLLRAGALDALASQAYATAATPRRPPWVGAGSPETHAVPRRQITLGSMEPGDVVEAGHDPNR